ncbi:(deoxy)nucleoside triphosphate pyrophosphohydrolase, partial [Clavibacter phaseoli]
APAADPERDRHAARLAEAAGMADAADALRVGVREAHAAGLDEHRIAAAARLPLADVRALLR